MLRQMFQIVETRDLCACRIPLSIGTYGSVCWMSCCCPLNVRCTIALLYVWVVIFPWTYVVQPSASTSELSLLLSPERLLYNRAPLRLSCYCPLNVCCTIERLYLWVVIVIVPWTSVVQPSVSTSELLLSPERLLYNRAPLPPATSSAHLRLGTRTLRRFFSSTLLSLTTGTHVAMTITVSVAIVAVAVGVAVIVAAASVTLIVVVAPRHGQPRSGAVGTLWHRLWDAVQVDVTPAKRAIFLTPWAKWYLVCSREKRHKGKREESSLYTNILPGYSNTKWKYKRNTQRYSQDMPALQCNRV